MAEPITAAAQVASVPEPETLSRVESFTREPFVLPGQDPAEALAPGSPRRRALDRALTEMESGLEHPSTHWRREFSLMLGLERLLNEEEARLADGTLLNPHQVDALSGTLTALLAESGPIANGNGAAPAAMVEAPRAPSNGTAAAAAPEPSGDAELEDHDEDDLDLDLDLDDEDDDDAEAEAAIDEDVPEDEEPLDWDASSEQEDAVAEAPEDPNAHKRFWFEHATGAGKTVAALGFVEASRTGGVLILTHRRNLVDQFNAELRERGYKNRITKPLMAGQDSAKGPVTVETYQWFVRNAGKISSAYTVVICDEAHTALGEKTAGAIREWTGPYFIGMTATGALIARHVTDLFPTQTSRFDLAQAARRGVISPLRGVRIPPGPGVRTIAKVPLRRGEVDTEFDQEMLAELLDQLPFNLAAANLYKTRFGGMPGVVYAAGVRHAYNLAEAFRAEGIKAMGVSGETPKRELASILARYERGEIDVLINAQLLAEGWNSPRATVCFHLAPTASKRIYQQRVGRVTRRHPGKESGLVVDFVHPATKHDDPVVTLHSLLDRDVYRGGAIVVGPVRRGRGRRVRVERRVLPVCADPERRAEVFERELWRIAVEHLDWGEQHVWSALAGARVAPSGWRRARAMLHFDKTGELKRQFLVNAVKRNKNPQLRVRALGEVAASKDPEAFDLALDEVGTWPRDEKREGSKVMLQALIDKRIGRRDQADAWIWRIAGYTADLHEEYAVQRWPETKRLLGLLANSSGGGHARNARRLVHAARKQDRRLSAALLAAATRYTHTPEAEEILRGARTKMSRKPSALSRELLRNFPKGKRGRSRRRKKKVGEENTPVQELEAALTGTVGDGDEDELPDEDLPEVDDADDFGEEIDEEQDEAVGADDDHERLQPGKTADIDPPQQSQSQSRSARRRRARRRRAAENRPSDEEVAANVAAAASLLQPARPTEADGDADADETPKPKRTRTRKPKAAVAEEAAEAEATVEADVDVEVEQKPKPKRAPRKKPAAAVEAEVAVDVEEKPKPKRAPRKPKVAETEADAVTAAVVEEKPKPKRAPRKKPAAAVEAQVAAEAEAEEKPKPKRAPRKPKAAAAEVEGEVAAAEEKAKPKRAPRKPKAADADAPAPKKRAPRKKALEAVPVPEDGADAPSPQATSEESAA